MIYLDRSRQKELAQKNETLLLSRKKRENGVGKRRFLGPRKDDWRPDIDTHSSAAASCPPTAAASWTSDAASGGGAPCGAGDVGLCFNELGTK